METTEFQSTLPMRGATRFAADNHLSQVISIHAPHAGSDAEFGFGETRLKNFNPRSPCGERPACTVLKTDTNRFQSTLPMRGATHVHDGFRTNRGISIHAPHAGSDARCPSTSWIRINFNPRSPCGERQELPTLANPVKVFQSTLPMRGATPHRGW